MSMYLTNKNILLISPEPWSHIFVSKHHYAIHLAKKGNKVYFLNPPNQKGLIVSTTEYDQIYLINYNGFIKGLRYLPKYIQRNFFFKKYIQIQRTCKVKFDVIWSFDNSVFYDFNALPENILKISHIVDLNQNFQTASAAKTADVCFGNTRFITHRLKKSNLNTHFINHGYNNVNQQKINISLQGDNKTKVFYAGNLDILYLDWELLEKIVVSNPDVDFLFAGKNEKENKLFTKNNVFYVGNLAAQHLFSYYTQADVLLLCYKAEEYAEQLANPHKMMEYLGSGKMIVSTKTEEYQQLAHEKLIAMSDKNTELPELFRAVVDNIADWNSDTLREKRRAYASYNSYDKQLERIEALIPKNEA